MSFNFVAFQKAKNTRQFKKMKKFFGENLSDKEFFEKWLKSSHSQMPENLISSSRFLFGQCYLFECNSYKDKNKNREREKIVRSRNKKYNRDFD